MTSRMTVSRDMINVDLHLKHSAKNPKLLQLSSCHHSPHFKKYYHHARNENHSPFVALDSTLSTYCNLLGQLKILGHWDKINHRYHTKSWIYS